jgi:hypothetical protein
MSYITYQTVDENEIKVFLEGKRVGTIYRRVNGMFAYKPSRGAAGEQFATVEAVKKSIEGDDE